MWTLLATLLAVAASGPVPAKGGLVALPGDFDNTSNDINNPWWPLEPGSTLVYIEEADDECIVGVVEIGTTGNQFEDTIDNVAVREVWDREFIDNVGDCDADLADIGSWELLETTYDWYAQDMDGTIWYFGEFTVAFDHDECEHTIDATEGPFFEDGCLDGSWQAGYDVWEEVADADILPGIIMLTNPQKGQFYFQEFWEDEATDMGKILNFKDIDTFVYGEVADCVKIKEWVPLDPGNVEHKYYCEDLGLVLVEGNAGGKTVYTDLVEVIDL